MKLLGITDGETVIASISHYDCRTHGDMMADGGASYTLESAGYNRFSGAKGQIIWFECDQTYAELYEDYNLNRGQRKYGKWDIKDVRILTEDEYPKEDDKDFKRENAIWGSRGKNGDEPLKYHLIKDLTLGHLEAILATQRIREELREIIEYWADKIRIMNAHQYLYYVKTAPVWSDYEYDMFCRDNKLDGKGGSDSESFYAKSAKELAAKLLKGGGE